MKIAFLLISFCFSASLFAQNTNESYGAWSEPAGGMRARLIVAPGRKFSGIDYAKTYLEFQNVENSLTSKQILPFELNCELRTTGGKPAQRGGGPISSAVVPLPALVLPHDSTLRINITGDGCTAHQSGGTFIYLQNGFKDQMWAIEKDDTSDYFLQGTFHIDKPKDFSTDGKRNWFGTLQLPKVKIPRE